MRTKGSSLLSRLAVVARPSQGNSSAAGGPQNLKTAVSKIVRVTQQQADFWTEADGWAPISAAALLSKSRLDRQCGLARTLRDYLTAPQPGEGDARLILGYVTLRALCEGTIKLIFSVGYETYQNDVDALKSKGKVLSPDGAMFNPLIDLHQKKISSRWTPFLRRIQTRGNAIHAFQDRQLGTFSELQEAVAEYRDFLLDTDGRLPYPDDEFAARRA